MVQKDGKAGMNGVSVIITDAETKDLKEILDLQYLAYQSEAKLLNNWSIPPLKQTLSEVLEEYHTGKILKAVKENDRIIGSVRGYCENGTLHIGKLMVHPEHQGQGIGTQLLGELERRYPGYRYELFTSSGSEKNIALYQRLGYRIFDRRQITKELMFVYLEKDPGGRIK